MSTTLADQLLPPDVAEFAARHDLRGHLRTATRLVGSAFAPVCAVEFVLERDPESDDEWIAVDVTVPDDARDVLAQNTEFTRQWVATVPPDVWSAIRVLYRFPTS
jgi:hypothetical protein